MTDANRRKELEALSATFQHPGRNVPIEELTEYLRLVGLHLRDVDQLDHRQLDTIRDKYLLLQLRELRIRESESVTAYAGKFLQQLEAKLDEEECEHGRCQVPANWLHEQEHVPTALWILQCG